MARHSSTPRLPRGYVGVPGYARWRAPDRKSGGPICYPREGEGRGVPYLKTADREFGASEISRRSNGSSRVLPMRASRYQTKDVGGVRAAANPSDLVNVQRSVDSDVAPTAASHDRPATRLIAKHHASFPTTFRQSAS